MKLDVTCMRYLVKEDFRVLQAVEMGMRNHELVPVALIAQIANLKHGGSYKVLSTLLRYKLVAHASDKYDGYRLSYLGFDILALRTLVNRGVVATVGAQIGVGKESDVFEAQDNEGNDIVIKIHRLGRTSFRAVRRHRDYMKGKSKSSWLYMSRLAATKEFAFMQILYSRGFPTPIPIDSNRHVVVMSRVYGFPLSQLRAGSLPAEVAQHYYAACASLLERLAEHGLVHCDLNEFNLLVREEQASDEGASGVAGVDPTAKEGAEMSPTPGDIFAVQKSDIILIDFPQMVSCDHPNAQELFERDRDGLVKFFGLKMRYVPDDADVADFAECRSRGVSQAIPSAYDALFAAATPRRGASRRERGDGDEGEEGLGGTGAPLLFSPEDDSALLGYIQQSTGEETQDGDNIGDNIGDDSGAKGTAENIDEEDKGGDINGDDEDGDEDDNDDGDEDDDEDDVEGAGIPTVDVRERVKAELRGRGGRHGGADGRRKGNSTKIRTKYGKIDRSATAAKSHSKNLY